MAATKVIVRVSPGKPRTGTLIARRAVKIRKANSTSGKPMFQTKAQIAIRITTANGEQRR